MFSREFDGIGLCLEPFAPVFARPTVLRQEHGIAISAAERAAEIRVTRPVEAAALDVTGGGTEDGTGDNTIHLYPTFSRTIAATDSFQTLGPRDAQLSFERCLSSPSASN